MNTPAVAVENPFVAVVAKKHRNLKKRVDKVSKLNDDFNKGKVYNSFGYSGIP